MGKSSGECQAAAAETDQRLHSLMFLCCSAMMQVLLMV